MHRLTVLASGLLGVLLGSGTVVAHPTEVDLEARAVRWATTHGPSGDPPTEVLAALALPPGEALDRLRALGEPARRALLRLAVGDDAEADRRRALLARLQEEEDFVEWRGLARDVSTLLVCGAEGAARARRIALSDAPADAGVRWWAERSRSRRFVPALDSYLPWDPWAPDAEPLRIRGRDRVALSGSAGLVRWDSAVTVEAWVKWSNRTSAQYLLSDEAWPELAPDLLPTSTKRGFALRRNPTGDGRARLDLTLAVAPNHWWSVESPPLAIRDDWEHIAATSDGRVVRLFRDGLLVAARSLASARPFEGLGDLSVGPRERAMENRTVHMDLRALRISEGARYVEDFVPTQDLPADAATLLRPEFRGMGEALPDAAAKGRRHAIVGATWVPRVDGARLRVALGAFGAHGRDLLVFEADRGGRSAEAYAVERDGSSEGWSAEIWSEREPDEAGHWFTVPLRVPSAGRYRVYLSPGLDGLGANGLASPFAWRIDEAPWALVTSGLPALRGGSGSPGVSPIGEVSLEAGERVLKIRLVARRTFDARYSLWFDFVALEPLG